MLRYCCGYYQFALWFSVLSILFTIYLKYPPPSTSQRLASWQNEGGIWVVYRDVEYYIKDYSHQHPPVNTHVLVLLHGFPTFSLDWHKVFFKLSSRFDRIIAPDFLGFGYSEKPADHVYTIGHQADMVEHYLTSRNLVDLPVHLMAHDYGDTVAQELIARYNEREQRGQRNGIKYKTFCLLNGGIISETNHPRWGQKLLLIPYLGQFFADYFTNYWLFRRGFLELFGENTLPMEDELQDYWAALRNNDGYSIMPSLLSYIEQRKTNGSRWVGALRDTTIPGLVIYGPSDPVNTPEFIDKFRELVPGVPLTTLDAHVGHYPQLEDPLNVMNIYFRFLHKHSHIDFSSVPLQRAAPEDARAHQQARVPYPR